VWTRRAVQICPRGRSYPPPTRPLLLHLHRGAFFGYTFILFFYNHRPNSISHRAESPSRNTIYRTAYVIYVCVCVCIICAFFSLSRSESFPRGRILVFFLFYAYPHPTLHNRDSDPGGGAGFRVCQTHTATAVLFGIDLQTHTHTHIYIYIYITVPPYVRTVYYNIILYYMIRVCRAIHMYINVYIHIIFGENPCGDVNQRLCTSWII